MEVYIRYLKHKSYYLLTNWGYNFSGLIPETLGYMTLLWYKYDEQLTQS